ncbi:YbaY family lipoprotein [Hymenobacter swuensis]|uniref:Lipoprotein-related protein n=1 Tax=Hymenobacter swuensis DY53 TaxID=1227739 RepID=W8EZR9_9BACT|nr:YbaY family lipoprotein [Hymenobacter swuensis]AHJ98604.1 lipoprotein-related protein [Hymenobacter swuensis DY53]
MKTLHSLVFSLPILLASCTASPSSTAPPAAATGEPATAAAAPDSVTGTITYRNRMALPPTAVVRVVLQDVSLQDVAATVLDSVTIRPNGRQVPFAFALRYDPALIKMSNTYTVQARITDGGRLLYLNDEAYPVITGNHPKQVELVLRPVQ